MSIENKVPMSDFTEVTDIADTARIIGLQDNENVKIPLQSLTAKILSRVDEDILTVNDINVEGGVTGFNPIGQVAEGDMRAVSGDEVFDYLDENFKSNTKLLDKHLISGKNKFNKDDLASNIINADGTIINSANQRTTDFIELKAGETYTISGGFFNPNSKRILLFSSKNNEDIIEYIQGEYTFTATVDCYMKTNVITTTSDFSNTLQIELGDTATPYESYVEPVIVEKIKEKFLPDTEDITINNELSDGRFIQSFENENENWYKENKRFIDSLRKQRGSDKPNKSKTIFISNPYGKILESVIVPVHLCWNNGVDNANGRHIFLNEEFEKDFSDLRFFNGAEMLDAYVANVGNYALFTDTGASYNYEDIIKRGDTYHTGLSCYTSTDLETFTLAVSNHVFAYADLEGNIYAKPNTGKANLVKFYKNTNYTTSKVVIEVSDSDSGVVWRVKNFDYDINGNLYVGSYQDNFSVKVWKSTDSGETWNLVLGSDVVKSQHVHNLVVDRTVTPNKIYVGCDGNMNSTNGTEPSQWESTDYGATWIRKDLKNKLGYIVDSGVMAAQGDMLLGGSEGAIKFSPSLYTSTDGGNSYNIALWGQNVHTAFKLENMYVVVGQNYQPYKSSNIYGSYDNKNWFKIYENVNPLASGMGTGDGYRYGSYGQIEDVDGTPCAILKSRNSNMPRLKMKVGEHYSSALVYVKIKNFPAGGKTIRIENNYLVSEPSINLMDNNLTGDLVFPLNERVNKLSYADVKNDSKWRLSLNRYGYDLNDKINIPFSNRGMILNSDFGINKNIITSNIISVNFWYSYKDREALTSLGLISIGNLNINLTTNKETLNIIVDSLSVNQTRAMRIDSTEQPCMLTVVINKTTNKVTVYNNEFKYSDIDINLSTFNPNVIKLGNKVDNFAPEIYISYFNLFYKELTQDAVSILFNKGVIL